MNTGWNDRRPVRQIAVNSLKPQASIDAINKIIDGKVIDHKLNKAYTTKSMYLTFEEPENEVYFEIRASDHSKIDEIYDDEINPFDGIIEINIYSKENKEKAIKFLKDYFSKVKKLPLSKDVFTNKVEKRVLKTKYPEIIETYLKKIKVDTAKTTKQVREQVLEKLLKMKPIGTLTKKEYEKSRGMFKLVGEKQHTGVITWIASTGSQVTINGETGKDFTIKKELHQALLNFSTGFEELLKRYLEK